MRFQLAAESRVGARPHNEDAFGAVWSAEAALLVVADGMGGRDNGEVASRVAVDVLTENFRRTARPRLRAPRDFLLRVFEEAHQAIHAQARLNRLNDVPSTTLVAALIQDGQLHVAHAGDSRLYLVRDGRVRYRTKDHSQVQQLIDQGVLTDQSARHYPGKNRIYNCLGDVAEPDVTISQPVLLTADDLLLVCSDGLWGPLDDAEVGRIFTGRPPQLVLPALLDVAHKRAGNGCDNLTGIAMRWQPVVSQTGLIDLSSLTPAGFAQWPLRQC